MSRSSNWADIADSPITPNPGLPLQPIPYRQPSYAAAQSNSPASPPIVTPHAEASPTSNEEDDGGWTVDYGARSYTDRKRRKEARRQNREAFSLPNAMSSLAIQQVPGPSPEYDEQGRAEDVAAAPNGGRANHEAAYVVSQGDPTDVALNVDHTVADVAAGLNRSGYRLDPSIMVKLKQFIAENKLDEAGPLPFEGPTLQSLVSTAGTATELLPPLQSAASTTDPGVIGREYTGPVHSVPPHMRYANEHDPNRLAVPNNRWGGTGNVINNASPDPALTADPLDSLVSLAGTFGDVAAAAAHAPGAEADWAPDSKVLAWVADISPTTPPSKPSPPPDAHLSLPSSPIARPDSAVPAMPPVTMYVSDDESATETDLPTPGRDTTIEPGVTSPTIQAITTPVSPLLRPSSRPVSRLGAARSTAGTDEAERRRRVGRSERRYEKSGVLWKRDPHPAFSAKFASKRLLIRFPFPIRTDAIRPTMLDHFSKYGSVRMVWSHEAQGDQCEQVILVFDNQEVVEACLADPRHTQCLIRSPGRAGISPIEISVELAPFKLTSKTVYVKITGSRHDARSRSASPPARSDVDDRPSRRHQREEERDWIFQSLPASINIDSVPSRRRFANKIEWWARVRPAHLSFNDISQRAFSETGFRAEAITCLDLGRRVAEKDVVPQLCEYFADIIDIVPPTSREQGWLVTVGGVQDGRNLMSELGKISGITTRWAVAEDGIVQQEDLVTVEESPMTRLEKHLGGDIQRDQTLRPRPQPKFSGRHHEYSADQSQHLHTRNALDLDVHSEAPTANAEQRAASDSPVPPADRSDADRRYPHLRRQIIPTYRGRTLREDRSEETPRFFDDSAVFVGRLVKEAETELSLFQRFSRYGQICSIEYNPKLVETTYATARILYSSKAAADRAIQFEQSAVSFGSLLKIEKRRVQACNVQIEETYVDQWGRACSPSMASQYSPPQLPMEDELLFVQPPPLNTGPPAIGIPFVDPAAFFAGGPPTMPGPWAQPPSNPMQASTAHSATNGQSDAAPASHLQLFPVLYAMGIGMYPPPGVPQLSTRLGFPPLPTHSLPTPPWTLHVGQQATGADHTYHGAQKDSGDDHPAPNPDPVPHIDPGVKPEPMSPKNKRRSPTIKGTRMVNGVLKVFYDDDELRQFCEEAGRPQPRPLADPKQVEVGTRTTPSSSVPIPSDLRITGHHATPHHRPIPVPFQPLPLDCGHSGGLNGLGISAIGQQPNQAPSMGPQPGNFHSINTNTDSGQRPRFSPYKHPDNHGRSGGSSSWDMRRYDQAEMVGGGYGRRSGPDGRPIRGVEGGIQGGTVGREGNSSYQDR